MSVEAARASVGWRRPTLPLSLRFAFRELRGGLKGFYVFLACIVLGVASIAGVTSLAEGLTASIAQEGRSIAGGDVTVSLTHRRATEPELDFLAGAGRVSAVATLRAMLRTDAATPLVELKGVDAAYPMVGSVGLRSGRALGDVLGAQGSPVPVVVDESLLVSGGLSVGDVARLGRIDVRIADVILSEPDRLSGGIGFGPRVLASVDVLDDAGLTATGSLVRWHYRIVGEERPLTDVEMARFGERANATFPEAGWRIETRDDAAPSLARSIERFAQFLTLVGLTSLTVGGVGVANAVRAYLTRRRRSIATLRVLGASPGFVVRVYLAQIMLLAFAGVALGAALGAVIPPVAALFLEGILPVSALRGVFPAALALAVAYGLLTALAFALWPLAAAHGVRPISLLRDEGGSGRLGGWFAIAAVAAGVVLAGLAVLFAFDRWVAAAYLAGVVVVFALLRGVAEVVIRTARSVPRPRAAVVRLAVANLHRREALTPTVILSLGLSLTLLATLSLVDGNLRQTLLARLPAQAPSFFFIDIQDRERADFVAAVRAAAPDGQIETQPMLRGRIVAINGTLAQDWPETEASWVLRGDRGITYAPEPPEGSRVVAGTWWPADGAALNEVSFDAELAGELGVGIGDSMRVNVLGREVEATISNLRTVDWETLGINFVMVFSPNVFAGAPHAHLATLALPEDAGSSRELGVLKSIAEAFPTVTSIRVKDALETVNRIVGDLVLAIRAAASITLVAAMLVLAGTLAASHRSRIYDAVVLKMLGARRRVVVGAYALEYALLGIGCSVFALLAGTIAAWGIVVELMGIEFAFLPWTAVATVAAGVATTVGLGLIGTWRALGEKPAQVLRNL